MSTQPIQRRLQGLNSSWSNDLPAKFLWTIQFQGRGGNGSMGAVSTSISKVLQEYEGRRWAFYGGMFDDRSDDDIGYLYAQQIALPQEQVNVATLPVKNSGGFVAGIYGDRRADYGAEQKLDITFLEQNKDIVDMFIRPWIVAVSYYGLIEDNDVDLKCNIQLNLHSRNPNGLENADIPFGSIENKRKTYIFEDCVPFMVEADQLSYGDLSFDELKRTTSFAFSKYKLLD